MGRGKAKKCASKWHKECKSSSTSLINVKNRLGAGNGFSKAFNLWKSKASMYLFRLFKTTLKEGEFY